MWRDYASSKYGVIPWQGIYLIWSAIEGHRISFSYLHYCNLHNDHCSSYASQRGGTTWPLGSTSLGFSLAIKLKRGKEAL